MGLNSDGKLKSFEDTVAAIEERAGRCVAQPKGVRMLEHPTKSAL